MLRVNGLAIYFYLGWSGSILQFRQNIIKVGSKSWLLTCNTVEIILEQRYFAFLSPSKSCENLNFSREIQILYSKNISTLVNVKKKNTTFQLSSFLVAILKGLTANMQREGLFMAVSWTQWASIKFLKVSSHPCNVNSSYGIFSSGMQN